MPYLLLSSGALMVLVALLGLSPLGSGRRQSFQQRPVVDAKTHPIRASLVADLLAARLPGTPGMMLLACWVSGLALALFLWPLRNGTVLLLSLMTGLVLPYLWVRAQAAKRRGKIQKAMGQVLTQLATVARTHGLPFQALTAALPSFPLLLRPQFESALSADQAGMPLPDALRALAVDLDGNFYAYQLAELAAVSIREGGSFADAVHQLNQRYRLMEELKAEERTSLHGYYRFTRIFAVASLLPMVWWVFTRSENLVYFVEHPLPRFLAGWAFATAIFFMGLPMVLSVDDA